MRSFANKTILIFGVNGLLGLSLAKKILSLEANVIGIDIQKPSLESQKFNFQFLDITDDGAIKTFFQNSLKIDGIINAAYPRNNNYGRDLLNVEAADFNENINLHLGSAFNIMKHAALHFNKKKLPLSLINIASVYGVIAPRFQIYENTPHNMPVEYAAIKAAIIHLTKYFCKYINHENFRVNCISPGGILNNHDANFVSSYSEFIAGSDLLMVDKLLPTFLHLLDKESQYINGQNIIIDQGFTL